MKSIAPNSEQESCFKPMYLHYSLIATGLIITWQWPSSQSSLTLVSDFSSIHPQINCSVFTSKDDQLLPFPRVYPRRRMFYSRLDGDLLSPKRVCSCRTTAWSCRKSYNNPARWLQYWHSFAANVLQGPPWNIIWLDSGSAAATGQRGCAYNICGYSMRCEIWWWASCLVERRG